MEALDNSFAHYGVKGMKWGVIRDRTSSGAKAVGKIAKEAYKPSQDAIKAQKYMTRAKFGGVRNLNNQEMRHVIARMELEQRYRDLYGERQYHDEAVSRAKRWARKGAKWAGNFTNDVAKDVVGSWLKRPGSNLSGRTSATAYEWGRQFAGAIEAPPQQRAIGR